MDFQTGYQDIIYGVAKKKALDAIYPVKEEIDAEKERFTIILASKAIGASQNPFEGGPWKPLTDAWLATKGASGDNPRFYHGLTGELGEDLEGNEQDANLGGKTTVLVRDWIWKDDGGFYNPRIKKDVEVVYRNERGQFAKKSEFARKPVEVKVLPFPNWRQATKGTVLNALNLSGQTKAKLGKNDDLRPLIIPFANYFVYNRVANIIAHHLRNL